MLSFAFAQTVPFPNLTDNDNTVSFEEKMDDVFGNIDLKEIKTQLVDANHWLS
jgi:hypothetical protein